MYTLSSSYAVPITAFGLTSTSAKHERVDLIPQNKQRLFEAWHKACRNNVSLWHKPAEMICQCEDWCFTTGFGPNDTCGWLLAASWVFADFYFHLHCSFHATKVWRPTRLRRQRSLAGRRDRETTTHRRRLPQVSERTATRSCEQVEQQARSLFQSQALR